MTATQRGFLAWLGDLIPGKEKRASDVLLAWPFRSSDNITPEMVWGYYTHERRIRQLCEIELQICAKRLHEQRAEIRRLQAEVNRLRPNARLTAPDTAQRSDDE